MISTHTPVRSSRVVARPVTDNVFWIDCMLKRPPPSLPKGSGKEAWIKMQGFLKSNTERLSFLNNTSRRKRAATTYSHDFLLMVLPWVPPAKQTPVKFEMWQKVMLDQIYVQCDGKPETETVQRICPTLKLEKNQVTHALIKFNLPLFRKETSSYCSLIV